MVVWSRRRSVLEDIARQSVGSFWPGHCGHVSQFHSHHLINQSAYSTWRCTRRRQFKQHDKGHQSREPFNGPQHSAQCRPIHLESNGDQRFSLTNQFNQSALNTITAKESSSSKEFVYSNLTQRTVRSGWPTKPDNLESHDRNQVKLPWLTRKAIRQRIHKPQQSPIVWKRWKRTTLADESRPIPRLRSYNPRTQALVNRGVLRWYPTSDYVYDMIIADKSHTNTAAYKDLIKFQKYVHNGDVYQAWIRRSWRGRAIWWRHALYCALLSSPSDALRIIADISRRGDLGIPSKTVADVLLLLDARYLRDDAYEQPTSERIIHFHETVCTYLDRYTKREGRAFLPWCIIRRLSRVLDKAHLTHFIGCVRRSKTEYTLFTQLHAMYRFLELDALDDALELFRNLTKEELRHRAVQSFCITVLRTRWHASDLHAFRRKLTTWFLKQGLESGCALRNVLLQNHLEAGDRQSAFALLESIRAKKLKTSEFTYSIFLKHTSLQDTSTISMLHKMAMEDRVLQNSTYLGGFFIQVAALGRLATGHTSFEALLALYETIFDTSDLETFGILEARDAIRLNNSPSSFALTWMVVSWIHENRGSPDKLVSAYHNYQFHIRNNHPRIAMLAGDPRVATAFVFAFGEHKSTLQMCTRVLQDMLQPKKPTPLPDMERLESVLDSDPTVPEYERFLEPKIPSHATQAPLPFNTPAYHDWEIWQSLQRDPFSYKVAPPETKTWNALLTALLRHNQFDAAEGVLKAMQQAEVQPNQMTWNVLIHGFAHRHVSLRNTMDSFLAASDRQNRESYDEEDDTIKPEEEAEKLDDWGPSSVYRDMAARL